MYKWVSSYPSISGYSKMKRWPTYTELCDMFENLIDKKNMGATIRITYPDIERVGDKFIYSKGDNDL
jgi:hypothetical protein